MIKGLTPPAQAMEKTLSDAGPNSEEVAAPTQRLRSGADAAILVDVDLPAGYHLNPSAPQRYKVSLEGAEVLGIDAKNASRVSSDLHLPLRIPVKALTVGSTKLRVQVTLFYCRSDNTGTCRIKTLVWQIPIEVTNDANAATEVRAEGKLTAD